MDFLLNAVISAQWRRDQSSVRFSILSGVGRNERGLINGYIGFLLPRCSLEVNEWRLILVVVPIS